jgi:hypothetical protein
MSPHDRNIFLAALGDQEGIEYRVLGSGFYRRVEVAPRDLEGAAPEAVAETGEVSSPGGDEAEEAGPVETEAAAGPAAVAEPVDEALPSGVSEPAMAQEADPETGVEVATESGETSKTAARSGSSPSSGENGNEET